MHETVDQHMLESILGRNNELAHHNREHFNELGLVAINIMSAPGAGKTTLLEKTLSSLSTDYDCSVIEGDMIGDLDAKRLQKYIPAVHQITTGKSCHLDAQMIARLLHAQKFGGTDYLFIENVGNLVCPAEFPLGEHKRVVLLSVTEGDDKPLKYPVIFHNCDVVVFTKCDLLPYVTFNMVKAKDSIQNLNPKAQCFELSVLNDTGVDNWLNWIKGMRS